MSRGVPRDFFARRLSPCNEALCGLYSIRLVSHEQDRRFGRGIRAQSSPVITSGTRLTSRPIFRRHGLARAYARRRKDEAARERPPRGTAFDALKPGRRCRRGKENTTDWIRAHGLRLRARLRARGRAVESVALPSQRRGVIGASGPPDASKRARPGPQPPDSSGPGSHHDAAQRGSRGRWCVIGQFAAGDLREAAIHVRQVDDAR